MKRLLLLLLLSNPVKAVPVISNFVQGQSNVTTESTQTVREIQKVYSYSTGSTWSVSGLNIEPVSANQVISPTYKTISENTINNVTSTWTGIDLANKPLFKQTIPGANMQYMETISQPGLTSVLELDRTTTTTSISTSISTFSQ